jgi:hypothetical protein
MSEAAAGPSSRTPPSGHHWVLADGASGNVGWDSGTPRGGAGGTGRLRRRPGQLRWLEGPRKPNLPGGPSGRRVAGYGGR